MSDDSKVEQNFQALLASSEQAYLTLRTQVLDALNQAQGTNYQSYFQDMLHQMETQYRETRDLLLQKKRDYDRVKAQRQQALLDYEVAKAARQAYANLRERQQ